MQKHKKTNEEQKFIEMLRSMKIKLNALDENIDVNDLQEEINSILQYILDNKPNNPKEEKDRSNKIMSKIILFIKLFTNTDDLGNL